MAYPKFEIFGTIVYITQFFGERPEIYKLFKMDGHNGVDMVFADRRNRCLANGVVNGMYDDYKGYGHYLRVTTDDGYEDTYAHFTTAPEVTIGQRITISDDLGPMGMSGFASGPHLHYGRKPLVGRNQANGYLGSIDPWPYLESILSNELIEEDMSQQDKELLSNHETALSKVFQRLDAIETMDTTGPSGETKLIAAIKKLQALKFGKTRIRETLRSLKKTFNRTK